MLTLIGKGAFGQIYLSYDMRDNIEVSIKKELKKKCKQYFMLFKEYPYHGKNELLLMKDIYFYIL